jgi:hypothetical protein
MSAGIRSGGECFDIIHNDEDDCDEDIPSRSAKDVQDEQAILVKEVVFKHRSKHQDMLKVLREEIEVIRALESSANPKREDIKKALLSAKKGCVCLTMTLGKCSYNDHLPKRDENP